MPGAHYNHHQHKDWFKYSDLITVTGQTYGPYNLGSNEPGKKLPHPKVYVRLFSHSAYDRANTSIRVNSGNEFPMFITSEFRYGGLTVCFRGKWFEDWWEASGSAGYALLEGSRS